MCRFSHNVDLNDRQIISFLALELKAPKTLQNEVRVLEA